MNLLTFFGKTLIVSAACIAVPIIFMKRIKKLSQEGFFEGLIEED